MLGRQLSASTDVWEQISQKMLPVRYTRATNRQILSNNLNRRCILANGMFHFLS